MKILTPLVNNIKGMSIGVAITTTLYVTTSTWFLVSILSFNESAKIFFFSIWAATVTFVAIMFFQRALHVRNNPVASSGNVAVVLAEILSVIVLVVGKGYSI